MLCPHVNPPSLSTPHHPASLRSPATANSIDSNDRLSDDDHDNAERDVETGSVDWHHHDLVPGDDDDDDDDSGDGDDGATGGIKADRTAGGDLAAVERGLLIGNADDDDDGAHVTVDDEDGERVGDSGVDSADDTFDGDADDANDSYFRDDDSLPPGTSRYGFDDDDAGAVGVEGTNAVEEHRARDDDGAASAVSEQATAGGSVVGDLEQYMVQRQQLRTRPGIDALVGLGRSSVVTSATGSTGAVFCRHLSRSTTGVWVHSKEDTEQVAPSPPYWPSQHCRYTAAALLLHCCCTAIGIVVTLLLLCHWHCCYSAVALPLALLLLCCCSAVAGAVSTECRPRSRRSRASTTAGVGDADGRPRDLDALLDVPARNNTGVSSTVVSHRGSVSSNSVVSNASVSGVSSAQDTTRRYGWQPSRRQAGSGSGSDAPTR